MVRDPDAVCALGASMKGWQQLMIGDDGSLQWDRFPVTPTPAHRTALAKRIVLQKLQLGTKFLSQESQSWRNRMVYIPVFDGEIKNQSVMNGMSK